MVRRKCPILARCTAPAVAAIAIVVAASCGVQQGGEAQPAAPGPAPSPAAVSSRPVGRIALRPRLAFSDKRGSYAGIAFVVESSRPLALISSHVVLSLLKKATLEGIELTDAKSKEVVMTASGLALPPGAPMDGYDFSTDFAFVALESVPDGIARIALAPERVNVGDAVDVIGCPPDGSSPEVTVSGTVSFVNPTRIELMLDSPGATRGFAGAPILSRATGQAIGVVQTVTASQVANTGLARATPAAPIVAKLREAETSIGTRPFSSWSLPK